jgi:hypothetical protein
MGSRYPAFDTSRLRLLPLAERHHDLDMSVVMPLAPAQHVEPRFQIVADRVRRARESGACVALMMGAHVLRSGVQRYLIDLMERGVFSCIAMNGACAIHDFELALIGQTTESVARYIAEGQFGLWEETGRINDIIAEGASEGLGFGEALGKAVLEGDFPHKDISLFAAAYRLGIPATVHVGIGCDIIHEHPNFDPAATGLASGRDFLVFAAAMEHVNHGVVMNFGSAVMAPEVYLKALSMARNVARQEGREVRNITALVCDLHELPEDTRAEAPRGSAAYYYRPWKTMLVRTVQDGGEGYYVGGRHASTIPQLWTAIVKMSDILYPKGS